MTNSSRLKVVRFFASSILHRAEPGKPSVVIATWTDYKKAGF
jgi:hypothetical protein